MTLFVYGVQVRLLSDGPKVEEIDITVGIISNPYNPSFYSGRILSHNDFLSASSSIVFELLWVFIHTLATISFIFRWSGA